MKKLMILAAVAACAMCGQAASADWSVTGATAGQEGYQVYIVGAISTDWTGVSDLAAAASAFGENTFGTIAKNGRNYMIAPTSFASDNISKTSADVFFVIVTGDEATTYNYVSADLKAFVYEGAETSPGTFGKDVAALLAGAQGTFSTGPVPTPEPTSAMLVLLGVAGLALKRRRA